MGKSIKKSAPARGKAAAPKGSVDVFPKIQELIAAQLKKSPGDIALKAHMQNDLDADSLDALEFVFQIEEAFNIKVTEEEAKRMTTVEDIVKLVTQKVQSQTKPLAKPAKGKA